MYDFNEQVILNIQENYSKALLPWYVGYSGGKDSSAVIKLLFLALKDLKYASKEVTIIYCDTGVEIPIVNKFVTKTLTKIKLEASQYNIPINIQIAVPKASDRYFVKVIGRGYPPPTNKFRWCTNRLRIDPVKDLLKSMPEKQGVMLLGIRRGESASRDKVILRHKTKSDYFFTQSSNPNITIYSPIINYDIEEVWATLAFNSIPKSIDAKELMAIYKKAGGECPVIKEPTSTPCGKGRFGCWTCTVVSRDHAVEGLIKEGHSELKPLLEYRNWLSEIRKDVKYRCAKRRNGQVGLGPFNLSARQEMLSKLFEAETKSGIDLISEEEISLIYQLWDEDKNSLSYLDLES
jgi:DNA sulfur modification protein DndC